MALILPAEAQPRSAPLIHTYSAATIGTDAESWITRQGPDGILYFGTDTLLSFDGERWRPSGINGSRALRGLDFGKNGKLWAAAAGEIGSFEKDPTGQWVFRSLLSRLPKEHSNLSEAVYAFAEGDGAVFVTRDEVLRWDGSAFHCWPFPGTRQLSAIRAGGNIYVNHIATGLYSMDSGGPKLVIPASTLANAGVIWLEQRPNDILLVTTNGLYTYADNKLTPFAPEASEFIRAKLTINAVRLADGRLAIGTFLGGVVVVRKDGSLDHILSTKTGLPTNSIYSLFVDRNDELWVTSDLAIFRLSYGSNSRLFDGRSGLPQKPIERIVRSQNKLYLTSDGRVFEFNPELESFRPLLESLLNPWGDMQVVRNGLLVAGTGGVVRISDGATVTAYITQYDVKTISPSRYWGDATLLAEEHSILRLQSGGKTHALVANLPDSASSIAEDHKGQLWIGTQTRGLYLATPTLASTVEAKPAGMDVGLPISAGRGQFVAAADGTVLAFTSSGGWIKGPNATRFTAIEGFPAWAVTAVSEVAADRTLWVVHPGTANRAATAARITIQGDHATWQPHSVEGLWKIGTPKCILAEAGANGETVLWIGGTTALLHHRVTDGPAAPVPNAPLLRTLARSPDTDALQPIAKPLPYSTRAIVFEFAAPEFARRPALHLETMLDGVDQGWTPADATSRREFTALREGRYAFRVRVVAETGVAGPATVSYFEINPPWWRTGAAVVGALFALLPAGYGIYHWRIRALRRRNIELEKKVLERTEQLAKASAAKTQFVANMSHDIRNPLNGIVGLALALEDTSLNPQQGELVATLRECTTYLSTLVDDVLDFATIEAGTVELRPGPFSPSELLRSIAAMFKMEAIASGATLQIATDPELPTAYVGDAGRIQQILVNFLTNALKYSGGRVRLTASIPADATEEIEFSVTDEGPGISAEGQKKLFTKFTRLTESQSKEITGAGLGLASCRLLAGLMSGSVGVRSSPGHGAQFYLRLPLEVFPVHAPDLGGPPLATPISSNCTVLLVEDTNYNALAAAAVLAKFGLTCERATTGAEALKLFAQKKHNLILLDRNLPDMDGTEVARRIRALEADGPRTIMLAVTAYCTSEDRTLCLNAGMDAFVGKPLTPEKLRRVLSGVGRRHLAAASMHVSPDVASVNVDVSLLEYISDGTNEGLNQQIELFLNALGDAEKQLIRAARAADFTLVGDAAHGVLSHARLVGSSALATAATELEQAARAQNADAFGDLLVAARREIHSLTAVVRRHPGAERSA